ncbi:hypothetical protein [Deinococcus sp. Marseille-Q6407]|uniref:hypothetical protein n=1 Tax=Deinococcus sp. Marseille-Q6407 TaxID=2969223 RepID=UPI0021C087EE|nr:hypothetical protein [Deinococcus sp. Marseille-Q6407]
MTLVGNFQHQNFSEALSNVKAQTGILAFTNLASRARLCVHLSESRVQAVFVNGRPLRCGEEAHRLLCRQFSERAGGFWFEQALPEDLRRGLNISLDQLLSEAPAENRPTGFLQKIQQLFGRASA